MAALFLGAAAIALSPIFVRLSELGPVTTGFHRVFLSLPVVFVWIMIDRSRREIAAGPPTAKDYALLMLSGVFFAGDLALWHWSINLTTVANATLFANFAPIFVTLGAFLLFKERFNRVFLGGLFCAVAGVAILVGVSAGTSERHLIGDALGIATAVFYASYILTVSRLRAKFSTATVMWWSGISTSVILLPAALITETPLWPAGVAGWTVLLGLAVVSHTGGQGLIAYALAKLPAAFSSVGLLFQPVLAALIAWALFAEAITGLRGLGGLVVLLGVYLAHRGSLGGKSR